ncbi:polysaccharide pyruvyl transferase family protein [Pseudomonas putida]|uniref:Polysaccharide pyruvyl transferase family protein n=1 Tax=Pseudomonas putida TaxID=303 RepID=A0A7V8E981_PSEPU|nr:polysaccharide pyruvyl transferase family protein [Pseudomonas putida]KAF0250618.1 hypothetical protein GN299_33005 [Pseudomonas putida]MDF3874331.1 polysaccharide pyruvyl transferase family protein [Pseudomonas putida]MDF3878447.1 polysaccharide pyruvyl transferase family protein [Pseudomonas putida]
MSSITLINFNDSKIDGMTGWPNILKSSWKPNYGDMLVCAAIQKLIPNESYHRVSFGENSTKKTDIAVLRGSTYLHNEFDFSKAIATIDSIESPIATVGLGAQNPSQDINFLDDNKLAHEFISKLAEKSSSISVRGEFSAEVVRRLGAKNVRVTGCPSLFYYSNKPEVSVSNLLPQRDRRIGISVHTGLSDNIYCRDPKRVFELHRNVILSIQNSTPNLKIFEQGTPHEFLISSPLEPFQDRIEAAAVLIKKLGLNAVIRPEQLLSWFSSFNTVEEWLSKARDFDAFIGFRFHGNMVALNQGIPCYYYTYDSRLEEFCSLYKLPNHKLENPFEDPVKSMLDHDWDLTNASIKSCSEEMNSFWAENGVPVRG